MGPEMIQITLFPSICMLFKTRTLLRETIRVRTDKAIARDQNSISMKFSRRRASIFRTSSRIKMNLKQQKSIPKCVSIGFGIYNKFTRLDTMSIWTHGNIGHLDISDNVGLILPRPETNIEMSSLRLLSMSNNTASINMQFDYKRFPSLLFLFLNGNYLINFPDESLKDNIVYLGVARCHLKSLPSYLSEFNNLRYLDVRDNNITAVNSDLKILLNKNQAESHFSGNVACNTDDTLDCKPLCSKYCWSHNGFNNGICDVSCNTKECGYDGGDCKNQE